MNFKDFQRSKTLAVFLIFAYFTLSRIISTDLSGFESDRASCWAIIIELFELFNKSFPVFFSIFVISVLITLSWNLHAGSEKSTRVRSKSGNFYVNTGYL